VKRARRVLPIVLPFLAALVLAAIWIGCGDDITNGPGPVDVPLDPKIRSSDGAIMVLIDEGVFTMGDPDAPARADNRPAHAVALSAFYIDEAEVTNSQYAAFLTATKRAAPKFWNDDRYNGPNQPVVGVTWSDASAYARWAGKTLPTEAQWEKAARGGIAGARYPWGNAAPSGTNAIFGATRATPADVKSTTPNALGIFDMGGNVWEWCADYYDATYYNISPDQDPRGPLAGATRVQRGGSYASDASALEVSQRSHQDPAEANAVTGFRCAKSAF